MCNTHTLSLLLSYVLSHKVFEDGGFSSGLATDDGNLGKVQRSVAAQRGKGILQVVNNLNQALHPLVGRHGERERERER